MEVGMFLDKVCIAYKVCIALGLVVEGLGLLGHV